MLLEKSSTLIIKTQYVYMTYKVFFIYPVLKLARNPLALRCHYSTLAHVHSSMTDGPNKPWTTLENKSKLNFI